MNSRPTFLPGCPLRPKNLPPGLCHGCGVDLLPGTHRWCSQDCADRAIGNHNWSWARGLALRRAGERWDRDEERWSGALCDQCGQDARAVKHVETSWYPDGRDRVDYWSPEVNHVDPRTGAGYGDGCHHHQTNLQVLCRPCHIAETTRQTRQRLGIPDGGRPRPKSVDRFPGERPVPLWSAQEVG